MTRRYINVPSSKPLKGDYLSDDDLKEKIRTHAQSILDLLKSYDKDTAEFIEGDVDALTQFSAELLDREVSKEES